MSAEASATQDPAVRVADGLTAVRARIATAAEAAGRTPDEVTLVAVSKTHPTERIEAANRVDELVDKLLDT